MVLLFNLGTSPSITRNLNDNSSNLFFFFLNKLLFLIINMTLKHDIFSIDIDLVK